LAPKVSGSTRVHFPRILARRACEATGRSPSIHLAHRSPPPSRVGTLRQPFLCPAFVLFFHIFLHELLSRGVRFELVYAVLVDVEHSLPLSLSFDPVSSLNLVCGCLSFDAPQVFDL